jgi:hypothetical protein
MAMMLEKEPEEAPPEAGAETRELRKFWLARLFRDEVRRCPSASDPGAVTASEASEVLAGTLCPLGAMDRHADPRLIRVRNPTRAGALDRSRAIREAASAIGADPLSMSVKRFE